MDRRKRDFPSTMVDRIVPAVTEDTLAKSNNLPVCAILLALPVNLSAVGNRR